MKKKWMKMMALLLGVDGVMVGIGGCEDEGARTYIHPRTPTPATIYVTYPGYYGRAQGDDSRPVVNAQVKVYDSESDYIINQFPLYSGATDESGVFSFEHYHQIDTFWYRIEHDGWNNQRFVNSTTSYLLQTNYLISNGYNTTNTQNEQEIICCAGEANSTISTTPTKLQLNILHDGQPVSDATVQLYLSQEAYDNDLKAQDDTAAELEAYASPKPGETTLYSYIYDDLVSYFSGKSDSEGVLYLDNLEPRQYWFKVTKGELSNATGTIKLEQALPNNPDITTSITVGIN